MNVRVEQSYLCFIEQVLSVRSKRIIYNAPEKLARAILCAGISTDFSDHLRNENCGKACLEFLLSLEPDQTDSCAKLWHLLG
jgi:hypothetical protein